MKYSFLILFSIIFSRCNHNQEIKHEWFVQELGIENFRLLINYVSSMDSVLNKTYENSDPEKNLIFYLEDLIANQGKSRIKNVNCKMVREFEKTELEDQFKFEKYDTVYLEKIGAIYTRDQEGNIEIEIYPPDLHDSSTIKEDLQTIRNNGYAKLIKKGVLLSAIRNNKSEIFINNFYRLKYGKPTQSLKDLALKILKLNPDYKNLLSKVLIYYEIYLMDLRNNQCGFK